VPAPRSFVHRRINAKLDAIKTDKKKVLEKLDLVVRALRRAVEACCSLNQRAPPPFFPPPLP
jgi:hypothetical protein